MDGHQVPGLRYSFNPLGGPTDQPVYNKKLASFAQQKNCGQKIKPFQGLSDLHLGYQKVTWKKLVLEKCSDQIQI